MQKKTVLEEALADAKQLKAMAIEQAKLSLFESVTPEMEKLLSQRLSEDFGGGTEEETDEAAQPDELKKEKKNPMDEISKLGLDETTLAAISKALGEASSEEEDEEQTQDEEEADETESLDLDAALAEIEKGSEDEEPKEEDEEKEKDAEPTDEALDIDAILAEMDCEDEEPKEEDEEEEETLNEEYGDDTYEAGKTAEKGKVITDTSNDKGIFTKDHIVILKDLLTKAGAYEAGKTAQKGKVIDGAAKVTAPTNSKVIAKIELQEAQIAKLGGELKDLNLFAAKNLYLNKVLVLPNLTESHKAKAITAFDKVKTVDAAKSVYEVLKTAITATPSRKTNIAESLGFKLRTDVLTESTKQKSNIQYLPQADEWKKRAGIKD